jgi:hypothetical protein
MKLCITYLFTLMILLYFPSKIWALPPAHHGKLSSANLGFRYSSLAQQRGVITYRDFQIDPVLSFFFFDDRLAFLGNRIDYQQFIHSDKIRYRTGLVSIGDDPLFPATASVKENNPDRKTTYEWSNGLDFFFPGYNDDYVGEVEISLSKDLKVHRGVYVEMIGKLKLFNFTTFNTVVEPNLVAILGGGDLAHNQYLYGTSASEGGLSYASFGFWLAFPGRADRHYPIVQLMRFSTVGDQNRSAEYAQGRSEGYLISFIASYPVVD